MEGTTITLTTQEKELLEQLKVFHESYATPNRREDDKNPVDMAIEGAKSFPFLSLRRKK